jgi:hypothetical protein
VDGSAPAADEALGRVLTGRGDGTIEVFTWTDEDNLHAQVTDYLVRAFDLPRGDADALRASLGAMGEYNGRPSFEFGRGGLGAENWQLLSPVRSRAGGVAGLNRMVRLAWRSGDAHRARRTWKLPPPMGSDEILFYDKVMCLGNHPRKGYDPVDGTAVPAELANGEIGMVVHWAKRSRKPEGLKVEFASQEGLQFTFWEGELNGDSEWGSGEVLELAYAITIHKAQGSQFGRTVVVVPSPSPLLSPELLYTALTRQRDGVALFVQGDASVLRDVGQPSRSETGRRLTRLFRAPDPFETTGGATYDGAHVHRTADGDMVRSKSEVIVADTLKRLGIPYLYEKALILADGIPRHPDFTIQLQGRPPIFWEHLGMLGSPGYRADWEAKRAAYAAHGILPWTEGGGTAGTLVWSDEKPANRGIDSQVIERLALSLVG